MRRVRARLIAAASIAAILVTVFAAPVAAVDSATASAQRHHERVTVIASGLHNPRGIDVSGGRIFVAEASAGRISVIVDGHRHTFASGLPTTEPMPGEFSGPVGVSARGNWLFATIGGGPVQKDKRFDSLMRFRIHGRTGGTASGTLVASIQAYRNAHPQPACGKDPKNLHKNARWCDHDQPPNATDSNAYGVAALAGRRALVTDAAGNELLLVDGHGKVRSVAKFPNKVVSGKLAGLPGDAIAEPVPTSVAVGPDGFWYVGELMGFPFTPHASRIWRISPSARGITCSESHPTSDCKVWKTGFTSVIDITFGRDGSLYVGEIVHSSVLNLFNQKDTVGAVWKVRGNHRHQLAEGKLNIVGGIAVDRHDTVYVTTWSVTNHGQVVAIRQ